MNRTHFYGKKRIATFALILLLVASAAVASISVTQAHTPAWTIPTYAYITASPNPVGVGQTAILVAWIDKAPPTAAGVGGDRWKGYTIEITKPDGVKETLGPFLSDPTSSMFTFYTPTQVGIYTLKFSFPGQVASLYNPQTGIPGTATSLFINDTYLPSSSSTTLTVQQNQITLPPDNPLPTSYWTRPIEGQNTNWVAIASNYLSPAGAAYTYGSERLQPDGVAPDSPHIMWTRPIQDGGIVGGATTLPTGVSFYNGLSYETKFNSPIIISGRLYYGLPRSDAGSGGGYICVDLRTGKQIWWQNYTVNPTFGQLYDYESFNQHGVIPSGYLWAVSGSTWIAYDSWDGNWLFNLTDVPSSATGTGYSVSSGQTYGSRGEVLRFVFNYNARWLALWNNTAAQGQTGATNPSDTSSSSYFQYRPVGKVINASMAYSWNVTVPSLPNVGGSPTVRYILQNDLLLGSFGTPGAVDAINPGCTVFALSLKPESRGSLLWIKNYTAPPGNITRSFEAVDPVNRVFTMSDKETMQWLGFSLDTGAPLWGPVGNTRALNFYPTVGSGGVSQVGFCAYGILYTNGYGGELFAYSTKNGTLLWKYNNTNSGLETPWGLYPLFTGLIADGKIYVYNNEHSPNSPLYKGESVTCLNATTGAELWKISSWAATGGFADWGWPCADGYLAYLNTYDMQIYSFGKGPSATTVIVSPKVSTQGSGVLIEGTVTDIAAGTKQNEQAARFPNGVPAVSDASMSSWMEYVYMQKPKPTQTTGVKVHLTALDPNNNVEDLGYATSDNSGNFAMQWTPPVPGLYKVTATFEGSNSYYSSTAGTAISVTASSVQPSISPKPTTTVSPTIPIPTESPMTSTSPSQAPPPTSGIPVTIFVAISAVVIAIVVVTAALVLRRRK